MGHQCAYDEIAKATIRLLNQNSLANETDAMLVLSDLIGRFHPVLVHLPIGILLLACFFQWLTLSSRFTILQPAIPVMLFWGMLGAALSCLSGYLLSKSGDYDAAMVSRHQWFGIITAILSLLLYLAYKLSVTESIARWVSAIIIVLVFITGHLGGSLTHGANYLTEGLNSQGETGGLALKPIPNIQEAVLYRDVIQPILQSRCYSCHGESKQKGKLRLDQQDFILKGGKDGKVLVAGSPNESEMIERLLLPLTEEDHMPPKEKPQPTDTEIKILQWWIANGADFSKHVKEFKQDEKIKPILLGLQAGAASADKAASDIPDEPIAKADDALLQRLRQAGVIIMPVGQNSNYLSASFFTVAAGADSLVKMLEPLRKQLVWLKLDNASLTDAAVEETAKLSSLTRLQLSNTPITDPGVAKLVKLEQLQSLNLVGTKVTVQGLMPLKQLKNLRHLYLYKTSVGEADWVELKKAFPTADIDSGKYTVPTFTTDTTEIKY